MLKLRYALMPEQFDFVSSKAKYRLLSGGFGSGKSIALCTLAIMLCYLYPGNRGFIGRKHRTDLEKTTMQEFFNILPDKLIKKWEKQKGILTLKNSNNSQIIFGGLDDPEKVKSLSLGFFCIDEASEVSKEAYQVMVSRLRYKRYVGDQIKHYGFMATNPSNAHHWLYTDFIERHKEGNANFYVVFSKTTDNYHRPEGYEQDMKEQYSDEFYRRNVLGEWNNLEGLVYNDFSIDRNVISGVVKEKRKQCKLYIAGDWGYNAPSAWLWFLVDKDDNVYIIDEYYERKKTLYECSEAIKRKTESLGYKMKDVRVIYTDPSEPKSRAELKLYGLHAIAAENDVIPGIQRVQSFLLPHNPRLFVNGMCKNFLKEINNYVWEKPKPGQSEHPCDGNDHLMDALRYFVFTHFRNRVRVIR